MGVPLGDISVVDTYGRNIDYLRLSVTDRCNLRCRYCMPADGICKKCHEEMLTEEEMVMAVRAAAELGFRKLRLTGGEPLIKKNIVSICEKCASIDGICEVCMTTNGILLPKLAKDLKKAGVDRLNISLDTLNPEKYKYITRIGTLSQALQGVEAALDAGFSRLKINVVLIGGFNEDEIPALADLTRRYPVDVRFIELMPMTENEEFGAKAYVPDSYVLTKLPELTPAEADGGVARLYRLPDAQGNVGLISPVSSHFCGSCSRIRLTADGKLKPCLHSAQEFSIKGMDLEGMQETLKRVIMAKPACHEPLSAEKRSGAGRDMHRIGG